MKLSTTAFVDTSLDCCDWTRLGWLGPECGVFWMALYSNGQQRTALGYTSLDLTGVHCARHCAPDWNTLHCTSVGGTGLDWTGLDWTGQHFTELDCCSCLLWTWGVPDGNTLQWTCVDGTGLEWAGQDCTGPERDYAWLHQIALHCTVLDELEIYLQHSLHSTGLDLERLFWIA